MGKFKFPKAEEVQRGIHSGYSMRNPQTGGYAPMEFSPDTMETLRGFQKGYNPGLLDWMWR